MGRPEPTRPKIGWPEAGVSLHQAIVYATIFEETINIIWIFE
jgi:hypothetical protein